MKKLSLLILITTLSLASCATHTSFNDFYEKNQKDSEFSMGLNASILRTFLNGEDYEDIKPLLKKAKHIRIIVFEEHAKEADKKFNKFIKKSRFDELIKIKDDGDQIKIYTLNENDKIKEVVLNIGSDNELVLLGLKTNLDKDDVAKIMEGVEFN